MVEGRFKKGCFTVFKDFPYLVYFILAYGAAVPRLLFRVIPGTYQGEKLKMAAYLVVKLVN